MCGGDVTFLLNYFDHLLLLLFLGAHQHKAAGLKINLSKIKTVATAPHYYYPHHHPHHHHHVTER